MTWKFLALILLILVMLWVPAQSGHSFSVSRSLINPSPGHKLSTDRDAGVLASFNVAQPNPASPSAPTSGWHKSIEDFGAGINKNPSENAIAIQKALDAIPASGGGTLEIPCHPNQAFIIDRHLVINRNQTVLHGSGICSTLRHGPHFQGENQIVDAMIETPRDAQGHSTQITDLVIDGINMDGNFYRPPNLSDGRPPQGGLGAIGLYTVKRVLITRSTFTGFFFDALSLLFGNPISTDVTWSHLHVKSCGRNGLSVGSVRNMVIDQVYVEDSPSQHWRPAAGNGIDIEVEGDFPLSQLAIRNSWIERTNTETAGAGIAIQPAYHPMTDLTVTQTVIGDHQVGIMIDGGSNVYPEGFNVARVSLNRNWIRSDGENHTSGGPIFIYGENQTGGRAIKDVVISDDVFNGIGGPLPAQLRIADARNISIVNHTHWADISPPDCAMLIRGDGGVMVNNTRGNSACVVARGANAAMVSEKDSQQLAKPTTPVPDTSFSDLVADSTLATGASISVSASDASRIFFFIDQVPWGFVDAPTGRFNLPSDLVAGPHTLGLRAVGPTAELSPMNILEVRITPSSSRPRN